MTSGSLILVSTYITWKNIVFNKMREFEANAWDTFIIYHPELYIAQACLEKHLPASFDKDFLSEQFPDFVCCLHTQVRQMGNLLIPYLKNTDSSQARESNRDSTVFLQVM